MSVSEAFRGVVDKFVRRWRRPQPSMGSTWSRAAEYKPATRGSAIQFNGHVGLD
jgi:hypothetical protein